MWEKALRKSLLMSLFITLGVTGVFGAELKMFDPLTGKFQVPKAAREYRGSEWMLPAAWATYTQGVIRTTGRNFILTLELLDGVTFNSGVSPNLVFTSVAPYFGDVTLHLLRPAIAGGTQVEWLVIVNSSFLHFPVFEIHFAGAGVSVGSRLVQGKPVSFQVSTRDASTGFTLEAALQSTLMEPAVSIALQVLKPGDKRIDVVAGRRWFWGALPDEDATSRLALQVEWSLWRHDGTWILSFPPGDTLTLAIHGNLSRIQSISFGTVTRDLTAEDRASSGVELVLRGGEILAAAGIWINQPVVIDLVAADTVIDPRTLLVDVFYDFGDKLYQDQDLLKNAALTKWSLNGTVLTAGYVSGNATELASRLYLKNESGVAGQVMVEVFTLPPPGQKSVSKGTVSLGTIGPRAVAMVKNAEDVLTPLAIPTSYADNESADYALEVVLTVPDATGVVQTFRKDFAFGWGMSLMNKVNSQFTSIAMRFPF